MTKRIVVACALMAVCAQAAFADNEGESGRVVGFLVNSQYSDAYGTYRGRMGLQVGNLVYEYRWGGTLCAGRDLNAEERQLLARAAGDRKLSVTPYWKPGQAGVRCVVAFAVAEKKQIGNIVQ